MKHALLAGIALAALAAPAAHATLSLTVLDNGLNVPGTETNIGGVLTFSATTDPEFSALSVTVTGAPAIPSPDLGVVNVDAHTSGLNGGLHVLTVDATQSNLPAFAGGTGQVTYTANTLIGSPGPSLFATTFAGASIASHDFPVGVTTGTFKTTAALGAEAAGFSDAQNLTISFGGATSQLFQSTSQLKAVATPEPAGIALFGIGLLGLAIGARRRKS